MNDTFNQYQYDDLKARGHDLYAAAKFQIIFDYLRGKESLRILNAGCGSGELSFMLANAGHTIVGIDPAAEYIELAKRQLAPEFSNRCIFAVDTIEDHKANSLYDCAIVTDVLEHIKDDQGALAKLRELVRPGGLIIIAVPALPALFGYHDEALGHFRRYTKRTLKTLILTAGLSLEQSRYFGFSLLPIAWLYSKVWRRPYPVAAAGRASFLNNTLKFLLAVEQRARTPLGTSLIAIARKP
ncbi:MAG: class I SAM-dependent methyltransferase [Patescibacteria group bacterium]